MNSSLPYPDRQSSIGRSPFAPCYRSAVAPLSVMFAIFLALLTTVFWSESAIAQAPRNFRIPPYTLPDVESSEAEAAAVPEGTTPIRKMIVDTDPGVDDAAALIWLFSQSRYEVDVLGVVTVAGNSTITNTTNNAQLILDWLGVSTPLIQGAAAPLVQPLSFVPSLIHGPDGLWFTFAPPATPDSADATAFYCATLEPGMLVLALGPLTNVALALEACPEAWAGVEIASLGGGKFVANQTPVTEYNYWQDPEAASIVVDSTISREALAWSGASEPVSPTLQIVLADSFTQFEINERDVRQLERRGVPAIQNLLPALTAYMSGLSEGGETPTLPDVSAAIYALDNQQGTAQSALVDVLAGVPEVARGQTIIGLIPNEKIVMIAGDAVLSDLASRLYSGELTPEELEMELGAILFSQPDNAMVVTDIDARRMHNIFLQELRARPSSIRNEDGDMTGELEEYDNHTFIPLVID